MAQTPRPAPGDSRSAQNARQGSNGTRVLMILAAGLVLALVAWFLAGSYGTAIDDAPTQISPSTTAPVTDAPVTTPPSATGAPGTPAPAAPAGSSN